MSTFSFQHEHQLWVENMNAKAVKKKSLWGKVSLTFWGWRNTLPGGLPGVLKNAGRPLDTMPLNRATCLDRWSEKGNVCTRLTGRSGGCRRLLFDEPSSDSGIWTTKKYELLACRRVSFTGDTLKIGNKHVQKWLNVVKWGVRQLRTM